MFQEYSGPQSVGPRQSLERAGALLHPQFLLPWPPTAPWKRDPPPACRTRSEHWYLTNTQLSCFTLEQQRQAHPIPLSLGGTVWSCTDHTWQTQPNERGRLDHHPGALPEPTPPFHAPLSVQARKTHLMHGNPQAPEQEQILFITWDT